MSLARRQALLAYAAARRCWIVEDDYDSEFRYESEPLPALRSLDRDGRVIHIGTFSKTLFPGLRLGYVVAPRGLVRDLVGAKRLHDFGAPTIEQAAMARFIADGSFERHIRKASSALRARREVVLHGLARHARRSRRGRRRQRRHAPRGLAARLRPRALPGADRDGAHARPRHLLDRAALPAPADAAAACCSAMQACRCASSKRRCRSSASACARSRTRVRPCLLPPQGGQKARPDAHPPAAQRAARGPARVAQQLCERRCRRRQAAPGAAR